MRVSHRTSATWRDFRGRTPAAPSFTGIHAMVSNGVIHYLDQHLAEVYREVKTKRFSALIQCEFDPDTRKVSSSKLLTPLYTHGA
jgi:hypothetical protein